MRKFLRVYIVLAFFSCQVLHAQYAESTNEFKFFEIKGHSGSHLYTGDELTDALENGYGALEIRYGWQSNNPTGW